MGESIELSNSTDSSIVKKSDEAKITFEAIVQNIEQEISLFTGQIDGLVETVPATIKLIDSVVDEANQKLANFERIYCSVKQESEVSKLITFKIDHMPLFEKLVSKKHKALMARRIVPRTFIVSLVSQYDAFLGRLLKIFFLKKPELLNVSERTLTLSQLLTFDSIDMAKEYVLEKEIESVLRQSHSEQFDWMERKFQIELRKDLDIWPIFIELTERRNLFVHTNGVVSSQYISVCSKHNVALKPTIKSGKQLGVPSDYFEKAYECIFEIGVKLAHVLWRKLLPLEREKADNMLNFECYKLLVEGRYGLACKLLDFATSTLKKHKDDQTRRMFIVNRAQAYKWKGDSNAAIKIMEAEDWSATSDEFKLAAAVIKDDFDLALKIMSRLGRTGSIGKAEYREWPLFREFRLKEEYASLFQDIFNEPLVLVTEDKREQVSELKMSEEGSQVEGADGLVGNAS